MPKIINLPESEVVALYNSGLNTIEVGEKFNVGHAKIWRIIKKYGHIRPRKVYKVNEDFFDAWSPDMAYTLGFITADGCICKEKRSVTMASNDPEVLEAIKIMMQSTHRIRPPKHDMTFQFGVFSTKIAQSLIKLGVGPRKSLTVDLPDVPDEFFWDFLRGEIDGDGHIYPPTATSREIGLTITGSQFLISSINKRLHQMIGSRLYAESVVGNVRTLNIYGKWAYLVLKNAYDNDRYGLSRKKTTAKACIAAFEAPIYCRYCKGSMGRAHRTKRRCDGCSRKRLSRVNLRYYLLRKKKLSNTTAITD